MEINKESQTSSRHSGCQVTVKEFKTWHVVIFIRSINPNTNDLTKSTVLHLENSHIKHLMDSGQETNRTLSKERLSSILYKSLLVIIFWNSEAYYTDCYRGLLFLLAFSLSRTQQFRSVNWSKRYNEVQKSLLIGNALLGSLSENSASQLSGLIDATIWDGLDQVN